MNCPYRIRHYHNRMKMVRHYDPFIQFDFTANFRRFFPFVRNNFSVFIQHHFAIRNITKQTLPVLCALRIRHAQFAGNEFRKEGVANLRQGAYFFLKRADILVKRIS